MSLADLEALDLIQSFKPTSNDGKFLVPKIVAVFQELKLNLENMFSSLQTQLIDITKKQDEKINKLSQENKCMAKKIEKLEEKLDAEDAYERKDSIIISGKKVAPFRAGETPKDTLELTTNLLREKLNYVLRPEEVSIIHRLGENKRRPTGTADMRAIYVKLCRRSVKADLLSASRTAKVDELYINEALSPPRNTIAYVLRVAKKKFPNIVSGSTTLDGKPHVWVKPPNPNARSVKYAVDTYSKLVKFCTETLDKPLTYFIKSWDH